ncbi:Avirulence (Avh) protein [Phytophthora megakarya]|uniref:Avirulence (Avh) protein n=1 Tax=Phytophthora megakarya TaxID=4795 RepID=A0A225V1E9_9STRA|nr:Avirulence (Avh) protein [Phytophthora megakarya]
MFTSSKATPEKLASWLKSGKSTDAVFTRLHLDKPGSLFLKPQFAAWVQYADALSTKFPEMSAMSTLTRRYGDEVLFRLIKIAKRNPATENLATQLETKQIQYWVATRKDPDEVFHLGLGKKADSILTQLLSENSLASTWVKYMDNFNRMYPEEKTTMIESFTKSFGDIGVTTMLRTAMNEESTRNLASKLESAQLKMWWDSGKSTDDVFKLLQLDQEAKRNFFRDTDLLSTWVSYVNVFFKENPDKTATLFSSMESRFRDRQLNEILNLAKKYPSMENIATTIQKNKIQTYLASNESPAKVFTLLGLADEGDFILSTPQFRSWMNYVNVFNERNPKRQESWFEPLRLEHEYGGFRMIEKALQNPNTVEIGEKVERGWLNFWLDQNHSPKDVFRFLHLDEVGEQTLVDRKFKTWTTYLEKFNKKHPADKTMLIDGLRANYNDIWLLRIFETSKNDPTTNGLIPTLENALINKWVVEKKTQAALMNQLDHLESSDEIIQRYVKRLREIEGITS